MVDTEYESWRLAVKRNLLYVDTVFDRTANASGKGVMSLQNIF